MDSAVKIYRNVVLAFVGTFWKYLEKKILWTDILQEVVLLSLRKYSLSYVCIKYFNPYKILIFTGNVIKIIPYFCGILYNIPNIPAVFSRARRCYVFEKLLKGAVFIARVITAMEFDPPVETLFPSTLPLLLTLMFESFWNTSR